MIKYNHKLSDLQIRKLLEKVKNNDGYCPCRLLKNENTKCKCKEFLESPAGTICHCGLYEKEGER